MEIKKLHKFLKDLKANNNKEFFNSNKANYNELKDQYIDLVQEIIFQINKFDKDFGIIDPKACIFRINRDLRFSKDKSPYKTLFSAKFAKNKNDSDMPSYYMHIDEENNLLMAGGLYNPSNNKLEAVRQKIISTPEEFEEIIYNKEINSEFKGLDKTNSLKNPPRGYSKMDKLIEFLKLKDFILIKNINIKELNDDSLYDLITQKFKIMYPFIIWLRSIR